MQGDGLMEANCVGFIDRKVAPLIAGMCCFTRL